MILTGILLICFGLWFGKRGGVFARVKNQCVTDGIVTAIEKEVTDGSEKVLRSAWVVYYVEDLAHSVKIPYTWSVFRDSEYVTVCYNRQKPREALLKPNIWVYVVTFGFVLVGLVICVVGAI